MIPKIVISGFNLFSEMAQQVLKKINPPYWLEYEITETPIELLVGDNSLKKLQTFFNSATIIISGDRSTIPLKKAINNLVIPVKVTGFDFLQAVQQINSNKIVVLNFMENINEISQISELIKPDIQQFSFQDRHEAFTIFSHLESIGVTYVVGGTWVAETAPKFGLNGVSYYSEQSLINAFNDALNILRAYRSDLEKSVLFNNIMDMSRNGIISTDNQLKINIISQSASRLLGIKRSQAIGTPLFEILPDSPIEEDLKDSYNQPQYNILFEYNQKKMTADIAPIYLNDENMGFLLTVDDFTQIQEKERKIRKHITKKSMMATYNLKDIIGTSTLINKTIDKAHKYSSVDSSILIHGETGTGKELFAQGIHRSSKRSLNGFVAINCAALPEGLLDSELFGYEEGAFTGAKKGGKAGLFELAHQGTIFLDEISELPIHLQSRLLRVLQEKEIVRIGGDQIIPIDVRVIAASNKNLLECIKAGTFREDLYFRINVLQLYIPPLRERKEDIIVLFKHFIQNEKGLIDTVTDKELDLLLSHHWPGNIRELENVAERFMVLFRGNTFDSSSFRSLLQESLNPMDMITSEAEGSHTASSNEIEDIQQALLQSNGNKEEAANLLGISRTTLWRKLKNIAD